MSEHDNDAYLRGDDLAGATGAAAAPALQQDAQTDAAAETRQADYVHTGMAFADWFNEKLRQLPNTQIRLGAKTAHAVRLHPDGRLECSLVASAGEDEQTFVAFEGQYLDLLVRKIGALGS